MQSGYDDARQAREHGGRVVGIDSVSAMVTQEEMKKTLVRG
jgi:hypothetical protein